MTYDQLKDLKWEELMDLIIRQANVYHAAPNYQGRAPDVPSSLPPPVLCLLGDFEIRARFFTPTQQSDLP